MRCAGNNLALGGGVARVYRQSVSQLGSSDLHRAGACRLPRGRCRRLDVHRAGRGTWRFAFTTRRSTRPVPAASWARWRWSTTLRGAHLRGQDRLPDRARQRAAVQLHGAGDADLRHHGDAHDVRAAAAAVPIALAAIYFCPMQIRFFEPRTYIRPSWKAGQETHSSPNSVWRTRLAPELDGAMIQHLPDSPKI